jgi:predicted Zn-dependent protease
VPAFNPFGPRVVVAPQVVVVPPPVFVGGGPPEDDAPNNVVPAVARRNDYIVISPQKNAAPVPAAEGRAIPHIDRIAMPVPDRPAFAFDPLARREPDKPAPPEPDVPEADPAAEVARLLRWARVELGAELYGSAIERLGAAIALRPVDPLPYFHRAQAQFAAGQYADAVASIREGMKRAPDWPASGFRPEELYGPNPGRLDAHIAELRRAVRDNPGEPALEFLLGYELWFAGDRPAAVNLFRSAAKRGTDRAIIERFLREAEKPR